MNALRPPWERALAGHDLVETVVDEAFDLVERGLEEGLLAAEVVVERTLRDAGAFGDLVERGTRVTAFGEQFHRAVDQRRARRLRVVESSGPHCRHLHNLTPGGSLHTHGMFAWSGPYREYAADPRYDPGHGRGAHDELDRLLPTSGNPRSGRPPGAAVPVDEDAERPPARRGHRPGRRRRPR